METVKILVCIKSSVIFHTKDTKYKYEVHKNVCVLVNVILTRSLPEENLPSIVFTNDIFSTIDFNLEQHL
jgi:hypothetical protein